jgi:exopolysaccharide production protein ExoZ
VHERSAPGPRVRLAFLDVLRVAAMALVVWSHLVGQFLERQGRSWVPLEQIQRYVSEPTAIINYAGWLGVALFFLISGFSVSLAAVSETSAQYAVRRVLRIYPALAVAVLGAWGLAHVRQHFTVIDTATGEVPNAPAFMDAVWNSTLINYLMVPQPVVLYVAWSLVVQVLFYALVLLFKPLMRYRGLAGWAVLATVLVGLETARDHGDNYFLLVASLSYVPILVAGQALWMRWSGRIGTLEFSLLTLAAWVLWNRGLETIHPSFLAPTYSYGVSLVIAYLIFVIALLRNSTTPDLKVVRLIGSRSYSVYLVHGPVGLLVLDALNGRIPYTLALVISLAAVWAAAELSYRLVELPSRRVGRRVRRPADTAAPAVPRKAADMAGV